MCDSIGSAIWGISSLRGTKFWSQKPGVFVTAHSQDFVILVCSILLGLLGVQTDGHTDRCLCDS